MHVQKTESGVIIMQQMFSVMRAVPADLSCVMALLTVHTADKNNIDKIHSYIELLKVKPSK